MATRAANPTRRPTNVTLDPRAVADARELGINVSQACEQGLVSEIKKAREAKWIEENWEAIQSSNAWVEKHGLPFAKYRMF
jgi:antitoxin CcdA